MIPVSFQTLPAMGSNISKVEALLTEEICQFEESGGGSKGNNRNSKSSEESSSKRQSTSIKRQKCPPSSRRLSNKEDQRDGTSSTTTTATNVTTESDSTASSSKSQRKARRKEKIKVVVLTSGSASSASSSKHNKSLDAVLATSSGSSDHQSLSSLDRSNLDVVRDKKRILEVCYGTTTTTTTGNKNSEMAGNDGIEVSIKTLPTTDKEAKDSSIEKEKRKNKKQKKDKKTKKKKKTFKKVEKGETKQTETIHQSKKKGAVPLEDKENIDRNSDSIGNPQDATETKEKMKLPVEKGKKVPPKGTTTAATATTKKKKVRVVNRRDAAGRVVRKRLKGTGRDKVVRKECFRKGKDAKIGLATISEDFYDGLVGTDSDDDCDDDDEEYECSSSSSDEDDDGDGDAFSSDLDGDNDRNETNEESSANEVSSTTADRRLRSASSSNPPSDVRNNSNRTIPSNEDNPIPTEPARIVDTISDTDNDNEGRENSLGESASSVDSTACTSTATAENAREEKSVLCCFGSFRIMICTGVLFVVAVAAATIMVGYVFVFRKDIPTVSPTLAPSIAPNVGQRPNLRPSLAQLDTFQPSSPIAATPAPSTSIFNTLSTSCYLPDDKPGAETAEAEYAPELFGFATISNWNGGYCGEGYVTILMIAGSGFRFSSFEVDQTGYYKVALRYNNADKAKKSLGLRIDDRDEGAFDLVSTGNETSWLVDDIDNILLSKGKHAIRVSVEETDDTTGPNVDWLTLVLQEPLSRFDYLSGLVAQANGMTAQTLSQTRTLQWMANEDSIDYSTLTSQEVIERYALIQIYHSAAGDTWIDNTQWLSELHACGWYGITCSKKDNINLVTDLMLGTIFDMFFLA